MDGKTIYGKTRAIKSVPKRTRNAITARIKKTIALHGFDETRFVANKIFQEGVNQKKLEKSIKEKEAELAELKRK